MQEIVVWLVKLGYACSVLYYFVVVTTGYFFVCLLLEYFSASEKNGMKILVDSKGRS